MKKIPDIAKPKILSTTRSKDIFAQVRSEYLTTEQKGAIKYFYERLHRIYRAEYRRQLPDESTERASKSEYGAKVMIYSKEKIDKGLDSLHDELSTGKPEFKFMPIDLIIGLIKNGGKISGMQSGAYSTRPTEAMLNSRRLRLDDQKSKDRRLDAASKSLKNLSGMFDD